MSKKQKTLDDFRPYSEAKEKNLQLRVELTDAERQLEVAKGAVDNQERLTPTQIEARKLLAGDDYDVSEASSEVTKLRNQIRILREAIAMSDKQVADAKAAASREIALSFMPDHTGNVLAVIKAMRPLVDALQAEEDLRVSLESQGVAYSAYLPPMQPLGTATKFRRLVEAYVSEAKQHGLA